MINIAIAVDNKVATDGMPNFKINTNGVRMLVTSRDYDAIKHDLLAFCECGMIICEKPTAPNDEEHVEIDTRADEKHPKSLGGTKRF